MDPDAQHSTPVQGKAGGHAARAAETARDPVPATSTPTCGVMLILAMFRMSNPARWFDKCPAASLAARTWHALGDTGRHRAGPAQCCVLEPPTMRYTFWTQGARHRGSSQRRRPRARNRLQATSFFSRSPGGCYRGAIAASDPNGHQRWRSGEASGSGCCRHGAIPPTRNTGQRHSQRPQGPPVDVIASAMMRSPPHAPVRAPTWLTPVHPSGRA